MRRFSDIAAKHGSTRAIASPIVASVAFVMELTLIPLLLSTIQADLQLTIGELAWVFNSYAIAVAISVLVGGWIGDIFGARKVFKLGVVLFTIGAVVASFAKNHDFLIVGRIIQGIGGVFFSPLIPVLLTSALPSRSGKILIIWGSIVGYIAVFAPLLGGSIIATTGWKPAFVGFALLATISLVLSYSKVTDGPEIGKHNLPIYWSLFGLRDLWLVFGYIFCSYGCITFFLFNLPLKLTATDFTAEFIGAVLAAMWLSFSVTGTLLRNLVDGHHLRKIILSAPVFIASGFFLAYLFTYPVLFFLSAVFVGIGFACSNAPSTQLVLKFVPKELRAISTSLDITFARLGGIVTVALFAQVGAAYVLYGITTLSVIAGICAWSCTKKRMYI